MSEQRSIFQKSTTERAMLKIAKRKHNEYNRTLDPTYDPKKPNWLVTTNLKDLRKLLEMAKAVQIAS